MGLAWRPPGYVGLSTFTLPQVDHAFPSPPKNGQSPESPHLSKYFAIAINAKIVIAIPKIEPIGAIILFDHRR